MPLITKLQPHPANFSFSLAAKAATIPSPPLILLKCEDISSFRGPYFWEKLAGRFFIAVGDASYTLGR